MPMHWTHRRPVALASNAWQSTDRADRAPPSARRRHGGHRAAARSVPRRAHARQPQDLRRRRLVRRLRRTGCATIGEPALPHGWYLWIQRVGADRRGGRARRRGRRSWPGGRGAARPGAVRPPAEGAGQLRGPHDALGRRDHRCCSSSTTCSTSPPARSTRWATRPARTPTWSPTSPRRRWYVTALLHAGRRRGRLPPAARAVQRAAHARPAHRARRAPGPPGRARRRRRPLRRLPGRAVRRPRQD